MSELHYKIEFFAPWHCGSGMGGGEDADYRPLLDEQGFPFVPGKTVKGLLREAAEAIGWNATEVARVFGTPSRRQNGESGDSTEGVAHFSNAELPLAVRSGLTPELREELLFGRYFTRLDGNGQTEDGSLRRGEFAIPLTLHGRIEGVSGEDAARLTRCLGYVKQLGLQRSRGFGRCRMSVAEVAQNAAASARPPVASARPADGVYHFQCRFLAPVVLNRSGATQGALGGLEYIPGSNWLGIAARGYADYGEEAFAVFHSGAVQFGFGYPMDAEGRGTLPCPASWFIAKGASLNGEVEIYGTPEAREKVHEEKQPKQVRGGFFVPGGDVRRWHGRAASFSLKSAYDSEKRRSEDSQMYGYTALPAGSVWHFEVRVSPSISDSSAERLVSSLVGRHQIGRSRTAQYGSVEIELLGGSPVPAVKCLERASDLFFVYAVSPLAFLDGNGEYASVPSPSELGFGAEARIDERYSQIRLGTYAPWNGIRKSRDGMRQVILPGSVIAVRAGTPPNAAVLAAGVGLFRCEGLGRVLLNPAFLSAGCLKPLPKEEFSLRDGMPMDSRLKGYLEREAKERKMMRRVYEKVDEIVKNRPEYARLSASQWGAIRASVVALNNYEKVCDYLFKRTEDSNSTIDYIDIIKNNRASHPENPGFLRHGTASRRWSKVKVRASGLPAVDDFEEVLAQACAEFKDERYALAFLEVLTGKVAKVASKKEDR